MKDEIRKKIKQFVSNYQELNHTNTGWEEPLVGFASAKDPLFNQFKKVISPKHALPQDLLSNAETVIAFFIPFQRETGNSNIEGFLASPEWALAYVETNILLEKVSLHIQKYIENYGNDVKLMFPTHNFDTHKLISDWSHRHVAFATGLGRFGLNNMLITEKGCCGRYSSLITSLKMDGDTRSEKESCLYFFDKSCLSCVKRCVKNALLQDSFDRHKCYEMCLINEDHYGDVGNADVCGKCVVGVPCTWKDPVRCL
jgi:epoxyqueuosine reductase QueG